MLQAFRWGQHSYRRVLVRIAADRRDEGGSRGVDCPARARSYLVSIAELEQKLADANLVSDALGSFTALKEVRERARSADLSLNPKTLIPKFLKP